MNTLHGAAIKMALCTIIGCALFAVSLQAGTPGAVPSFRIEPGDVVSAQVRLFSTALPQLYLILNTKKFPDYEMWIKQNRGRTARIYVCEETVADFTVSETEADSELTFLLPPQVALNLAQQLMKKHAKSRLAH